MKKILIYLVITSCIFSVINCSRKNITESNCGDINKLNLLIQEVFKKKYIFPVIGKEDGYGDSTLYNFLISNVIPSGKIFYIRVSVAGSPDLVDSIKVISANQDLIKNKLINTVGFFLKQTNIDTTDVNINVSYGSVGKYLITDANFSFAFDNVDCKWIQKDSTFWQY